jgi:hypothetical protein
MFSLDTTTKAFFPSDNCWHPTDTLIEYLRIGPMGGLGVGSGVLRDDVASYYTGGAFMSHPKAQFASAQVRLSQGSWHETRTIFEDRPVDLLYQRYGRLANPHVTSMVRRSQAAVRHHVELGPDECVRGEGLVIFGRWTKPYADIKPMKWWDLREEVNEIVTGWWHAVPTKTGWRVFADNLNDLFHVRMALPRNRR